MVKKKMENNARIIKNTEAQIRWIFPEKSSGPD
jgi:hypothetical protein